MGEQKSEKKKTQKKRVVQSKMLKQTEWKINCSNKNMKKDQEKGAMKSFPESVVDVAPSSWMNRYLRLRFTTIKNVTCFIIGKYS